MKTQTDEMGRGCSGRSQRRLPLLPGQDQPRQFQDSPSREGTPLEKVPQRDTRIAETYLTVLSAINGKPGSSKVDPVRCRMKKKGKGSKKGKGGVKENKNRD